MKTQFTAADFCEKPSDKNCPHGIGLDWCSGTFWASEANKVLLAIKEAWLAEFLKDAQTVWGHMDDGFGVIVWFDDEEAAAEGTNKWTGRVIQIMEIKK